MKNLVLAVLLASAAFVAAQTAGPTEKRTLFVYDEVNKESAPYVGYYQDAFKEGGLAFDALTAAEAARADLARYDAVAIHGMVMAFNWKSPVRDWLKTRPNLSGKRVSLLVTANRWFLASLSSQLTGLLGETGASPVDAVSMATKKTSPEEEREVVIKRVRALFP